MCSSFVRSLTERAAVCYADTSLSASFKRSRSEGHTHIYVTRSTLNTERQLINSNSSPLPSLNERNSFYSSCSSCSCCTRCAFATFVKLHHCSSTHSRRNKLPDTRTRTSKKACIQAKSTLGEAHGNNTQTAKVHICPMRKLSLKYVEASIYESSPTV